MLQGVTVTKTKNGYSIVGENSMEILTLTNGDAGKEFEFQEVIDETKQGLEVTEGKGI